MKKLFLFGGILFCLGLAGCGASRPTSSNQNSESNNVHSDSMSSPSHDSKSQIKSTKVESIHIESETNKKIYESFVKNDLKMFINNKFGIHEFIGDDKTGIVGKEIDINSGFTFYTKNVDSGFQYIINVQNYSTSELLEEAYRTINNNKITISEYQIVKNDSLKSLMCATTDMPAEEFANYSEVFKEIK